MTMEDEIKITFEQTYVHVRITGRGTRDNALRLWREIAQACHEHHCYKVLGEQDLKISVSTLEALDHPEIFREAGITEQFRIAWVDLNPRTRETTQFIRNVLANRAMGQGKIFSRFDEAKKWLLGSD